MRDEWFCSLSVEDRVLALTLIDRAVTEQVQLMANKQLSEMNAL